METKLGQRDQEQTRKEPREDRKTRRPPRQWGDQPEHRGRDDQRVGAKRFQPRFPSYFHEHSLLLICEAVNVIRILAMLAKYFGLRLSATMTRYKTRLFLPLILSFIACLVVDARIGESRSTIERRITQGGHGLVLDDKDMIDFYLAQTPFTNVVVDRQGGEYVIHSNLKLSLGAYYKLIGDGRAYESRLRGQNGQPVKEPAGWLLFVVYYNGKSVLEYYKRSAPITAAEVNGLLALNQGSSNWVREKLPQDKYPNKDYKPVLDHALHRSDGELLANPSDNALLIFHVDIDDHLSKAKHKRESEDAPDSLAGF